MAPAHVRERVDAAIRRAVDKDLKPFLAGGTYRSRGEHALGLLAIALYAGVRAGLDPNAAPLAAGFEEIDKLPWKNTYSVSLALLALESRSVKKARKSAGETHIRFEKAAVEKRDL